MVLNIPDQDNIFAKKDVRVTEIIHRTTRKVTLVVGFTEDSEYGSIQEALNDLPADGGEIFIKEGTYDLGSNGLTIDQNNVIIRGNSWGVVITGNINTTLLSATNFDNLVVENVYFKGGGTTTGRIGIAFTNCDYARIKNCKFDNNDTGVKLDDCSFGIVENNLFDNSDGDGAIQIVTTSTACLIKNNLIKISNAIFMNGADRCIIDGNILESPSGGIHLDGGANNNVISNNICNDSSDTDKACIFLEDNEDDNVIIGNVTLGTNKGIRVDSANGNDNIVIGNNIHGSATPLTDSGTNTISAGNLTASGTKYLIAGEGIDITDSAGNKTFALANKTSYKFISAHGFTVDNPATKDLSWGIGTVAPLQDNTDVDCNVELPHGAVITGVIVYGNAAATAETWILYRRTNAGAAGSQLATANVGTEDTTISDATVDNSTYQYLVKINSMDTGDTIYGMRITYTTDYD